MNMMLQTARPSARDALAKKCKRRQVAALCHRKARNGREFLLITSRETKRWVIPKGWPIRGLSSCEAALQEAWEEAGVKRANVCRSPEGSYFYRKRLSSGIAVPVQTFVYSAEVTELSPTFPEADERRLRWVTKDEAACMVDEPELREIFLRQSLG